MHITLIALFGAIFGAAIGVAATTVASRRNSVVAERKASAILEKADERKRETLRVGELEAKERRREILSETEERQAFLRELEKTLQSRELSLESRTSDIEKGRLEWERRNEEVVVVKEALKLAKDQQDVTLERIAGMNRLQAKELLLEVIEKDQKEDLLKKMKQLDEEADSAVEAEARKKLATVLSRISSEVTAENTVFAVTIPSEEMKGRLIGKEGRNIQAFEKATGVDLLIDDSPDSVLIASFDPVRREVGRVALEQLIKDGRIHPARIEEVVQKSVETVAQSVRKAGEAAVVEAKVAGLPKEIVRILGQLKFRTSYGQNQLQHAIETSKIAGLMADELGADATVSRKAGLLHDLGKALDFEIKAPHHHISADIAKKYSLGEDVVHAILAHHDDVEPTTTEAWIVRTADAISGARPGARRNSYEEYVERLRDLEKVATSFAGVDRCFAIQAVRELRILVRPGEVSDLEAAKLAKAIAAKVEEELTYPGQVKVNVIRESRSVAYAA